jgi:hypothetical protein
MQTSRSGIGKSRQAEVAESATARIFLHNVPLAIVIAYQSDQMRHAKNGNSSERGLYQATFAR